MGNGNLKWIVFWLQTLENENSLCFNYKSNLDVVK